MIDAAAEAHTGRTWGLADHDLAPLLDPRAIVATRTAEGGAAPSAIAAMVAQLRERLTELDARARERADRHRAAEEALLVTARAAAAG